MGERTSATLMIEGVKHEDLPPDFSKNFELMDWGVEYLGTPQTEAAQGQEAYFQWHEVRCGVTSAVGAAVIVAVARELQRRGLSFTRISFWEDPEYDWLGDLLVYDGNKIYARDCDSSGNVILRHQDRMDAMTDTELCRWVREVLLMEPAKSSTIEVEAKRATDVLECFVADLPKDQRTLPHQWASDAVEAIIKDRVLQLLEEQK